MIDGLKKLSLADLIRVLRRDGTDALGQLSRSVDVFTELAAVHFDVEMPRQALEHMLIMELRHVSDEDLDVHAPNAREWILSELDYIFDNPKT